MRYSTLLIFLVTSGAALAVASDTCQDGVCTESPDEIKDDNSALQTHSAFIKARHAKKIFVHRDNEVKLTFTENIADESAMQCVLKGNLVDVDSEAGSFDIDFSIDFLDFNITDASNGQTIFSERTVGVGTEYAEKYLAVEGDMFTLLTHPPDSDSDDSLSEVKSELVHMGKEASMKDSAELSNLRRHAIHRHRSNASSSQTIFTTDIQKLLEDPRDNAVIELGIALINAGINGMTHPCAWPVLVLSQKLVGLSTKISSATAADIEASTAGLLQVRGNETAATVTQQSCNGCGKVCSNEKCGGRCSGLQDSCSAELWVCGSSDAHQGCCEHDGFCSCGGMHWYECWMVMGDCWDWMCASGRCERCDLCEGTTWWARRRHQKMGYCQGIRRRRSSGWR